MPDAPHAQPDEHACEHHHCGHADLATHHPRSDAICVDDVSFSYPHTRPPRAVLDKVTLHVERGCNLGIIGPNGAGKTTLLRIILGLLRGYRGSVRVMGLPPEEACRTGKIVGYVPQRLDAEWKFPLSVRQVVRLGLVGKTGVLRRYRRDDLDYAEDMMRRTGVADFAHRPIGDLSGGQQQRAFIARALAPKPDVLILDEPTVGVDEAGQQQLATVIHDLHRDLGLTVLMVSHDLRAIAASCNRVAVLNRRIHYHDAPSGLTRDVLREVFAHDILREGSGLGVQGSG